MAGEIPAFSAVTVSMGRGGLWRNGDEMTSLLVDAVVDNYFDLLGAKPVLGRLPDASHEYAADAEPPIVLAYLALARANGRAPRSLGQRIEFRDQLWRMPPFCLRSSWIGSMGQRHVDSDQ